jgi:hypothetical protein
MPESSPPFYTHKAIRWVLWWLALAVWTAMLVTSQAAQAVTAVVPDQDMGFWVSKVGHVAGYALLSILAGCLPVRFGWRIVWWLFVILHAAATEFIQYSQIISDDRHGSWRDVGLDVCGVILGWLLLLAWRRLRRAWPERPAPCD